MQCKSPDTCKESIACGLVHAANQSVDKVLAIAGIATLHEVVALLRPAASWVGELEGPEEVVGMLEVGPDGMDFVHEILHADDVVFTKVVLDDFVVSERDALAADLAEAALVDELADGLEVGISIRDIGLDFAQHVQGGLVRLHEHALVDLAQAEQLEDLAGVRMELCEAAHANHEQKLRLRLFIEAILLLSDTLQPDLLILLRIQSGERQVRARVSCCCAS